MSCTFLEKGMVRKTYIGETGGVSYSGPGFLSSSPRPSMPKKCYSGSINCFENETVLNVISSLT